MTQLFGQNAGDLSTAFGSNTLPDFDGVVGEWWFGGDAPSSRLNSITGALATLIGAPTYAKGYASMSNGPAAGMTLDVGAPTAMSIVMLFRPTSGTPIVVSSGDLSDYSLYCPDTGHVSAVENQFGSPPQSQLPLPAPVSFTLVMGVYLPATKARIFRCDANGVVVDEGSYTGNQRPDRNSGPIQIGGSVNPQIVGGFDLAALHVTNDLRGADWLEAIRGTYGPYAASRGVPVN